MFEDILRLGNLSERTVNAEHLVGQLRLRLQQVQAKQRSNTAVFYEVWHDPILTAGGPSFLSDLIQQAGGRNIFAGINIETPHVNVESVIRARPELLVIPLEKRHSTDRSHFWAQWRGMKKMMFCVKEL